MKTNTINNRTVVLASLLLMVAFLLIGFSYAFWSSNFEQTKQNETDYQCFNVTFKAGEAAVFENGYPQTDEDGLKNPVYTVSVKNECDTYTKFNVIYNVLNTSSTGLDQYMRIGVNGTAKKLDSLPTVTSTLEGANTTAYVIDTGGPKNGETKEYKINTWMDENTSEEAGENKKFEYRITIDTQADFMPTE